MTIFKISIVSPEHEPFAEELIHYAASKLNLLATHEQGRNKR